MRIRAKDKAVGALVTTDPGTAPRVPRLRRFVRPRFPWQPCLVMAGYLLPAALAGAALHLWWAPLPPLPAVEIGDGSAALSSASGRAGSKAALEVCRQQAKVRELFQPSIPVPSENRLGKTTAQELAARLQFLGIVGNADDVAALVLIPNRGPGIFRAGDRVAEFVLKKVKPDCLILGLGDEEATLKR